MCKLFFKTFSFFTMIIHFKWVIWRKKIKTRLYFWQLKPNCVNENFQKKKKIRKIVHFALVSFFLSGWLYIFFYIILSNSRFCVRFYSILKRVLFFYVERKWHCFTPESHSRINQVHRNENEQNEWATKFEFVLGR